MYQITTDSACDIKKEALTSWGVAYAPLTLKFEGEEDIHPDDSIDVKAFYDKMRAGGVAKTQAVNTERFIELFEPILERAVTFCIWAFPPV
jgi:fatty acid-binding protein DegV